MRELRDRFSANLDAVGGLQQWNERSQVIPAASPTETRIQVIMCIDECDRLYRFDSLTVQDDSTEKEGMTYTIRLGRRESGMMNPVSYRKRQDVVLVIRASTLTSRADQLGGAVSSYGIPIFEPVRPRTVFGMNVARQGYLAGIADIVT